MTETASPLFGLPMDRERPLDPPDVLTRLRTDQPIAPLTFPDGHEGWIVTGYAQARAILADSRFSALAEYTHAPIPGDRAENFKVSDIPPGIFNRMDHPEHTRYRRQLAREFSARRIHGLTARVTEIAEEYAEAMVRTGPPADLVADFAVPVPMLVICELLGVPFEDQERFLKDSTAIFDLETSREEMMAAVGSFWAYLTELIQRRRAEPTDDLISGLVSGGELNDAELTGTCMTLLIGGYESTATTFSLGTYALLNRPEQLAALRADDSLMDTAVDELLRYLSVLQHGTERTPLEDAEMDGVVMRAGQTALIHWPTINRDPVQFPDPDKLDVSRENAATHMAFGHGAHHCVGAQLARIELRAGFRALLRRFENLRLAVPVEEIRMRASAATYGPERLPITW
ncbi:cytochrome P450 [Kibdelosporangium lantanae]